MTCNNRSGIKSSHIISKETLHCIHPVHTRKDSVLSRYPFSRLQCRDGVSPADISSLRGSGLRLSCPHGSYRSTGKPIHHLLHITLYYSQRPRQSFLLPPLTPQRIRSRRILLLNKNNIRIRPILHILKHMNPNLDLEKAVGAKQKRHGPDGGLGDGEPDFVS